MTVNVSELYVYPLKSARGIALERAEIGPRGIRHDRQWLFIDEGGAFVAQRGEGSQGVGIASLCLVVPALSRETLTLNAPGMPPLVLPLAGRAGEARVARVWDSAGTGIDQGEAAAQWASEYLGRERPGRYRLLRMADDAARLAGGGTATVAFADGYPLLMIGQASLDDLNSRLAAKLPMNRFRPNIVLAGAAPYAEDNAARFQVGAVELVGRTRCSRCVITTTDQASGARGKEPLATLATYRREEGAVYFGRNCSVATGGIVARGDTVRLLD